MLQVEPSISKPMLEPSKLLQEPQFVVFGQQVLLHKSFDGLFEIPSVFVLLLGPSICISAPASAAKHCLTEKGRIVLFDEAYLLRVLVFKHFVL
jgi:hypothetical protein